MLDLQKVIDVIDKKSLRIQSISIVKNDLEETLTVVSKKWATFLVNTEDRDCVNEDTGDFESVKSLVLTDRENQPLRIKNLYRKLDLAYIKARNAYEQDQKQVID